MGPSLEGHPAEALPPVQKNLFKSTSCCYSWHFWVKRSLVGGKSCFFVYHFTKDFVHYQFWRLKSWCHDLGPKFQAPLPKITCIGPPFLSCRGSHQSWPAISFLAISFVKTQNIWMALTWMVHYIKTIWNSVQIQPQSKSGIHIWTPMKTILNWP